VAQLIEAAPSNAEWSSAQRSAIETEAGRILAHPAFRTSKRCVAMLQRLIQNALDGNLIGSKERILGIEVFGRDLTYDTNADPIVRMTASEIRKRLAQYYQASTEHHEVVIHLTPGSYMLEIRFERQLPSLKDVNSAVELVGASAALEVAHAVAQEVTHGEVSAVAPVFAPRKRWIPWLAIGLSLVVLGAVSLSRLSVFRSTQDLLWAPLLDSGHAVTICLGDTSGIIPDNWAENVKNAIQSRDHWAEPPTERPVVTFGDVSATVGIVSWLSSRHYGSNLQRASTTQLDSLRRGPVVLIGAFDNFWYLALLSNLRYSFRVDPATQEEWIQDTQHLSSRQWRSSGKLPYSDASVDYAIVTRVYDADTGNWILAVGGMSYHGTEAAVEMMINPAYANDLPASLRSTKRNFQLVLKTAAINGRPGRPQILDVYSW
jgi:hypothetical protein